MWSRLPPLPFVPPQRDPLSVFPGRVGEVADGQINIAVGIEVAHVNRHVTAFGLFEAMTNECTVARLFQPDE